MQLAEAAIELDNVKPCETDIELNMNTSDTKEKLEETGALYS